MKHLLNLRILDPISLSIAILGLDWSQLMVGVGETDLISSVLIQYINGNWITG
jgi:hypothetical protein